MKKAAARSPAPAPLSWCRFDTRLGRCALVWSAEGLKGALLPDSSDRALARSVEARHPGAVESTPTQSIRALAASIRSLFDGDLSAQPAIDAATLDLRDVPPFHAKVYEHARGIAPGTTRSYLFLAEAAGSPRASRAVGQSMANNPFPIVVPCHRVLASDGKLTGFSAPGGTETKLKMLGIERDAALRAQSPQRFAFDPEAAVAHLRAHDRTLAKLIDRVGPFAMKLDPTPSVFTALAQAIAYQQLTGKAAETIWTRVVGLFPYRAEGPAPELVAKASEETLRSAGLSTAKSLAIHDLAKKCVHGVIPTIERLHALEDEAIIDALTEVRGIGRWTVEMLLMFRLGRGDVLPVDDYGVKKGFQRTFGGSDLPDKKTMIARAARWAPYRSVASWYLWRATELPEGEL